MKMNGAEMHEVADLASLTVRFSIPYLAPNLITLQSSVLTASLCVRLGEDVCQLHHVWVWNWIQMNLRILQAIFRKKNMQSLKFAKEKWEIRWNQNFFSTKKDRSLFCWNRIAFEPQHFLALALIALSLRAKVNNKMTLAKLHLQWKLLVVRPFQFPVQSLRVCRRQAQDPNLISLKFAEGFARTRATLFMDF